MMFDKEFILEGRREENKKHQFFITLFSTMEEQKKEKTGTVISVFSLANSLRSFTKYLLISFRAIVLHRKEVFYKNFVIHMLCRVDFTGEIGSSGVKMRGQPPG